MSKHTAGPWEISASGLSVDAGTQRIRMEASNDLARTRANARLIAAAPELLKALKSAVTSEYAMNHEANDEAYPLWVQIAESAIAKAEGKNSGDKGKTKEEGRE